MDTRLFHRFKRRRLGMGQSRFGAALGKGPAAAASGTHQKDLDFAAAHTVTNRRHLFTFAQLVQM